MQWLVSFRQHMRSSARFVPWFGEFHKKWRPPWRPPQKELRRRFRSCFSARKITTKTFEKKNSWKFWKFRFFRSTRKFFARIFRFFKIENLKNLKISKISFKILKELARFPLRSLRNWPKLLKKCLEKNFDFEKSKIFKESKIFFIVFFGLITFLWSRNAGNEV